MLEILKSPNPEKMKGNTKITVCSIGAGIGILILGYLIYRKKKSVTKDELDTVEESNTDKSKTTTDEFFDE